MIISEILSVLDAPSFTSPWFWLALLALWTVSGRGVLGVPNDVLAQASTALRHDATNPAGAHLLLDWLSLQLPRWKLGQAGGALMTGGVTFALSSLALLGFGYQLEMAQALVLLGLPMAVLLVLKLRLAAQLEWVLDAARLGQPAQAAANEAMRRINRYRMQHMVISLLAVAATAFWAARWIALHPNGM